MSARERGLTVTIAEPSIERGEKIMIEISGAKPVSEAVGARVNVMFADRLAGGQQAQTIVQLSEDGTATARLDSEGWPRDAVFRVSSLVLLDSDGESIRERSFSESEHNFEVHEPGEKRLGPEEIKAKAAELKRAQDAFHKQPLGDSEAVGAIRWQAVVLVEYLLIGSWLSLPGVDIHPTGLGNPALSEARIFDQVMSSLIPGFTPVSGSEWGKRSERNRPIAILQFENVYAPSIEGAGALVDRRRDQVLDLLALNRRTAARVIGSIFTAEGHPAKIQTGSPAYTGNVLTGPLAGESIHTLVAQDEAAQADPVLALALSLLRDAHGERNPDFAYFRYWAMLELLAGHIVAEKQPVMLLDGNELIGENGKPRSTSERAPQVYELIARIFRGPYDEFSHVRPAADLWEAVQAWYGRRNAAAHSGSHQGTPDPKATRPVDRTGPDPVHGIDEWLSRLRDTCSLVLAHALGGRITPENKL